MVVPPQLRSLTASAPFHVCERSGFSPDRADYLSRQAKLNFTSLERHHKASLSGSPPRSPNEPTPTHTHTETKGLSDRHLPEEARHVPLSSKPSAERCHVAAAEVIKRGHARQSPTLQISTFRKQAGATSPLRCHHLYPTGAACTDAPRTQIRPRQLPLLYVILLYPESRKAAAAWLHRCILGKNQNGWFSVSHLFARSRLVFF